VLIANASLITQVSEFKMAEIGSEFPITHTPVAW